MKVLVFDVPAEFGGVYTILRGIYSEACECAYLDWTFILGKADLDSKNMVTVEKYPWIKKSWIHRFVFDVFLAPHIVRRHKPNLIVSFHNNGIRGTKIPQLLYMHQAMMLGGHRYSLKESKTYWFYQNIQAKSAFRYIRQNHTVVQTEWMKNAIVERAHVDPERIKVISPDIKDYNPKLYVDNHESRCMFFYPANYMPYKHHDTIIKAVQLLGKEPLAEKYDVVFTDIIPGSEGWDNKQKTHIKIVERLPHEQVINLYAQSVLLFPSELESFGLPLLEARLAGSIILVADTLFAREILDNYPNAYFFEVGDSLRLSELMRDCMEMKLEYHNNYTEFKLNHEKGWKAFVNEIIRLI